MNEKYCQSCGDKMDVTTAGFFCPSCAKINSDMKVCWCDDPNIKTTKKSTTHSLKHTGGEKIEVEKFEHENKITISEGKEFVFIGSDPKRVKRIGELLIEASEL